MVEPEPKKKEEEALTKAELMDIIKQLMHSNQPAPAPAPVQVAVAPIQTAPAQNTQNIMLQQTPMPAPQPLTPAQEKYVIATQMMKVHRNIILLSLMLMILPLITALASMMDPMYGFVVAIIGIVFPAWQFGQSIRMQSYLAQKYNLRPVLQIRPPTQNNDRGLMF